MTTIYSPHASRGFSLFEILITVTVVGIGLLGLAGLQFAGLKASNQAQDATYASQLAQDAAERILANREGWTNGQYKFSITSATSLDPGCQTGSCNSTQIADYDQFQLHQRMYPSGGNPPILSNPVLNIISHPGGITFTVVVAWDKIWSTPPTSCPLNDQTCLSLTMTFPQFNP